MMSLMEQAEYFVNQSREEPVWLNKIRNDAWSVLEIQGFPTLKTENWKYTRLKALLSQKFEPHCRVANVLCNDGSTDIVTEGDVLVFIDGFFVPSLSRIINLKIELKNFAALFAKEEHPPLLSKYFTQYADLKTPGFTALNTIMMQDGAFIHLPKNTVLTAPIQLLFINSGSEVASYIRNLFILESGSQAEIIETYISQNDKVYFTNTVTEVVLESQARLSYYKTQQEGKAAFHIHSLYTQQAEYSQLKTVNIDKGGKLARNWLQSNLAGAQAQCDFSGLYIARQSQYIDNHTRVEHLSPHTISREFYKGVLFDESQAVFNGQIFIAPDAQKSDAEQKNRNLILSDEAEIDTKPQLEIYADDVKCAHGATIADLSEDVLFYLGTRGIAPSEAQSMLLDGFMNEILHKIPIEKLRENLQIKINE